MVAFRPSRREEDTMVKVFGVRVAGPLAPHAQGLWEELRARGYTALSARNLLRLTAHLSRWLASQRFRLADLTRERLEAFSDARRRAGYVQFLTPRALAPILHHLVGAGVLVVSEPRRCERSAVEDEVQRYVGYLVQERGLSRVAADGYGSRVRRFLAEHLTGDRTAVVDLQAEHVTAFVLAQSRRYAVGTTKIIVTALRSYLRFLYLEGTITMDLSGAVPAVAGWRLSGLPKALDQAELRKVLATCDRRTAIGRRDFAMLLLMARLGLRRGDVAALELDDIDWVRGELVVRGKGQREERLPLPADVGAAVAAYLRGRRAGACRRVFQRSCAPCGPLEPCGITAMVSQRFARAGIRAGAAHRLRYTAATEMLRRGGSLDEIAQVLRHKSHDTTAIYAKVDRIRLRELAQPWPGGAR